MKKLMILFTIFISMSVYAQFREPAFPTESIKDGIIDHNSGSLFGFLNSDDFQMRHSYNLSYSSFGSEGLALGMYTNSLLYKLSNNMNVQVDASIIHSPYSTFGKDFQNQLNGVYITRAAFNYRPWDDFFISIQYRNLPMAYHYSDYGFYSNRYNNPFFGQGFFDR